MNEIELDEIKSILEVLETGRIDTGVSVLREFIKNNGSPYQYESKSQETASEDFPKKSS